MRGGTRSVASESEETFLLIFVLALDIFQTVCAWGKLPKFQGVPSVKYWKNVTRVRETRSRDSLAKFF